MSIVAPSIDHTSALAPLRQRPVPRFRGDHRSPSSSARGSRIARARGRDRIGRRPRRSHRRTRREPRRDQRSCGRLRACRSGNDRARMCRPHVRVVKRRPAAFTKVSVVMPYPVAAHVRTQVKDPARANGGSRARLSGRRHQPAPNEILFGRPTSAHARTGAADSAGDKGRESSSCSCNSEPNTPCRPPCVDTVTRHRVAPQRVHSSKFGASGWRDPARRWGRRGSWGSRGSAGGQGVIGVMGVRASRGSVPPAGAPAPRPRGEAQIVLASARVASPLASSLALTPLAGDSGRYQPAPPRALRASPRGSRAAKVRVAVIYEPGEELREAAPHPSFAPRCARPIDAAFAALRHPCLFCVRSVPSAPNLQNVLTREGTGQSPKCQHKKEGANRGARERGHDGRRHLLANGIAN